MVRRLMTIQDWEELAREARFQPADMAALCTISLRHLERFFMGQFGQTPGQWVRDLRCRLARQLISEGWSNKAVASELSFANESHLCHEFRRAYGTPPQTFAPRFRPASRPLSAPALRALEPVLAETFRQSGLPELAPVAV